MCGSVIVMFKCMCLSLYIKKYTYTSEGMEL